MASWQKPTEEQIERAIALLAKPAQRRLFFSKLENPLWLEPLRERGFFKVPPPAERDADEETIRFPRWPESEYLIRIAAEAPDEVVDTILAMDHTDNVRVHVDFFAIAEHVSTDRAVGLLPLLLEALHDSLWSDMLAQPAVGFALALASGGKVDAALEVARTLLALEEDPEPSPLGLREPRARVDSWDYGEAVERLTALADFDGLETLDLFSDLLVDAVRCSRESEAESDEDYSYIWRPAIEEHEQNLGGRIADALVSAVRDVAVRGVEAQPNRVTELVTRLEERPYVVFRRLALHLLAEVDLDPDGEVLDLVRLRVTERAVFDDYRLRHELHRLLRRRFGDLDDASREVILGWIEEGPDTGRFAAHYERETGEPPDEVALGRFREHWQAERLSPIHTYLTGEWRERWETLVAAGEPEHADFVAATTSWVGPTSPLDAAELGERDVPSVVDFLRSWKPSGQPMEPTIEGLGRALTGDVARRPGEYAEVSGLFEGLDPTYVRSLFSGLRSALDEGMGFEWPSVLELAVWAVAQPRGLDEEPADWDRDPGWGWCRKELASLLQHACDERSVPFPIELRERVWPILAELTEDPDPTPEHELRYGGTNMDPSTLSVNTVRGQAFHAVASYLRWLRRHFDGEKRAAATMSELAPEAFEALTRHLDPDIDPFEAVRSVYGQWLATLAALDEGWVKEHLRDIFPQEEEQRNLRRAAWSAYVVFARPSTKLLELLRDEYLHHVRELTLATEQREVGPGHPGGRGYDLVQHLMAYYWWGSIDLGDDDGLMAEFYTHAAADLRRHALEYLGRSMRNLERELEPEEAERLRLLWESRFNALNQANIEEREIELQAFGWWFAAGKLGEDWLIGMLLELLRSGVRVDWGREVMERLAAMVSDKPAGVLEAARLMVERPRDLWEVYTWRDQLKTILEAAYSASDDELWRAADDLLDRLLEEGYEEMRAVRPPSAAQPPG